MSHSRTPSKRRVSSHLSSNHTIASEKPLLKDEVTGREFLIPFRPFAEAFLLFNSADTPTAVTYRDSQGFRDAYSRFSQSVSSVQVENTTLYTPLVELMNHVVDSERALQPPNTESLSLMFRDTTSAHGIQTSLSYRKPDIVGFQTSAPSLDWNAISVACEYKRQSPPSNQLDETISTNVAAHSRSSENPRQTPEASSLSGPPSSSASRLAASPMPPTERDLQLARYLLEMRSNQVTRAAVLGILFMNTRASFWYADSDSTIKSGFISIDSVEFISAMICLSRANAETIGYCRHYQIAGGAVATWQPINSVTLTGPETPPYGLEDIVSVARTLHGRCSRVLGATQPNGGGPCAIKISEQVDTREPEAGHLEKVRSVAGVVQMITSFVLGKLSQGPRSRLPPGLVLGMRADLLIEDREVRVLVLVRCMPLYRVIHPWHFLTASISLLNTICDLYEEGHIMHRDISVNNLMVDPHRPWVGVLIDLDLALDLDTRGKQPASSLHRTGTLPFMALDLLHDDDDYPQHHRHDLESFAYVLTWIAARYQDGAELNEKPLPLDEWCDGGWTAIRRSKRDFLGFSTEYDDFSTTRSYTFLMGAIHEFRLLLDQAHNQVLESIKLENIAAQSVMVYGKGKKRDEIPDEGYTDGPAGSKRRRPATRASSGGVKSSPYPKDLDGVNRLGMVSILTAALERLGDAPEGTFHPIDEPTI